MSYLNLNNDNWLDLIFEGRNQNYGAYALRKQNNTITIRSFLFGIVLFFFFF